MAEAGANSRSDAGSAEGAGRYARQVLLPGIGREGQARLWASHALIAGCGALGCGVADLLARAGVGRLTIIDRDIVEASNLQRQTLFDERHLAEGLPKAQAAAARLGEINSAVRIDAHAADLGSRTVESLVGRGEDAPGVLVDGTDNFETRLLLNDVAVSRRIPYVYAGVVAGRGMAMVVAPWRGTPCLRCLVDRPPPPGTAPTCDTAGVLGAAVGAATAFQGAEAIKILLGEWDRLSGRLVTFDLWEPGFRAIESAGLRDPECVCCVGGDFEHLSGKGATSSVVLCGRGSVQVLAPEGRRVDLAAMGARLAVAGEVTASPFLVRVRLTEERADAPGSDGRIVLAVFADGRAIVSGTLRPERARAIYDRYVGN